MNIFYKSSDIKVIEFAVEHPNHRLTIDLFIKNNELGCWIELNLNEINLLINSLTTAKDRITLVEIES